MNVCNGTVYVVDDDLAVREAVDSLLASAGFSVKSFPSAQEFLTWPRAEEPGCLVLDVRMPVISGLDLQQALNRSGHVMPIVFITGHGDIPMSVHAMRSGAIEFLTKPFEDQHLIDAVMRGLAKDAAARAHQTELSAVQHRYDSLSAREKQVMGRVIAGRLNREIAAELGISEITVKVHRGRAMDKMAAKSLAMLVQAAQLLRLPEAA